MCAAPSENIYQAPADEYAAACELAQTAPAPARVANVMCATAGWTDPTLLKGTGFYPKSARAARDRLSYYAEHFPFVEVDATYYALLPPTNAHNWLLWTPPSFTFNVKAHPVLTGQPIDATRLPADLREAIADTSAGSRVYAERLPPASSFCSKEKSRHATTHVSFSREVRRRSLHPNAKREQLRTLDGRQLSTASFWNN